MYQFLIEIRNALTGEGRNFADKQAIADFLAGREDAAEWTGFESLGELPSATVAPVEVAVEPTAESPAVVEGEGTVEIAPAPTDAPATEVTNG